MLATYRCGLTDKEGNADGKGHNHGPEWAQGAVEMALLKRKHPGTLMATYFEDDNK